MAKELSFSLNGATYNAVPMKLERKKIYGWSDTIATDNQGDVCSSAYLWADRAMIIPAGGIKQGITDNNGRWVERSELVACDTNGVALPIYNSSFDSPIELNKSATIEEFLDHTWEAVYQINNQHMEPIIGEEIYSFPFTYRGGTTLLDGYLLNTLHGLFLFAGKPQTFPLVELSDQTTIDDDMEMEENIEDLDFEMF